MGFQLGIVHGFSLSQTLPIFIETGGAIKWDHLSNTYDSEEMSEAEDEFPDHVNELNYKMDVVSLEIPVNLVYKFSFGEKFALKPQLGVYVTGHIIGKQKLSYGYEDGTTDKEIKEIEKYYKDELKSKDLFSKKDMGSKDAKWNRFNMGWRIGVSADISKKFNIGIAYASDFSKVIKNVRRSEFAVSVGCNF